MVFPAPAAIAQQLSQPAFYSPIAGCAGIILLGKSVRSKYRQFLIEIGLRIL